MPLQTIFDLSLHSASRTLVAATHGRSQWKADLTNIVAVEPPALPSGLALSAPRPNPSGGVTNLSLELPSATAVEIDVYDTMGRRTRALASGRFGAGRHTVSWDGRDDAGRRVRPGVYFVRAQSDGASDTQRVVRVD